MKRFNLNRRDLLKSTAAAAGASSLSMAMVEQALANNPSVSRVIFWYVPEGCAQQAFWPVNTGNFSIDMTTSIDGKDPKSNANSIRGYTNAGMQTYVLQELKRHESEISLYSGFKNNGSDATDPHKQVVDNALTGGNSSRGSIDQILGLMWKDTTPVPSIYTGIFGQHVNNGGTNNGYLNPLRTAPVNDNGELDFNNGKNGGLAKGNANWNPMETYHQVFGSAGVPAPDGGGNTGPMFSDRHSTLEVLNQMEARLEAVRCVGGEAARLKYEALLSSFREIEAQTNALIAADEEQASMGGPDLRFDIPSGWENRNGNTRDKKYYWNQTANYERLMNLSINTAVAALALNRTRVSLLQFSGSGNDNGDIDSDHYRNMDRVHLDGTVEGGKGVPGLEGGNLGDVNDHFMGHKSDAIIRRNQARVHRWYYKKLGQLIDKLKSIPDGVDGSTLFDSTLIVTCSEFSMYNHRSNDMPYMTIGDANGAFVKGQYLDARQNGNFRSHADFFLSVGQGLGANMDRFGTSTNPYMAMRKS